METLETLYTVTLRDYPEQLTAQDRIAAETRFAKELERQLGGPEQVAAALQTMRDLEACPPDVATPSTTTLLRQWGRASAAARQAGLRELGEAPGAFFDVEHIPF